ncbi:MAG: kelch repeat-containing protein [Gaiellaceae bacterium]
MLTSGAQKLNEQGRVSATGDEVLSPYWRRADTSQPVSVRQLAAYHTQGNVAVLRWHARGSTSATQIFTSKGDNAQTVLPFAANTSPPALASASFTPSASAFGFKVDGEWSDPALNDQVPDTTNGCPGPCGHHVRFWPVRDESSRIVPDTWLMAMDYAGINYDYQDNVYLISNVAPADPALTPGNAVARIDVAGAGDYTDTMGHVWKPDTGLFSPPTAIDEGATVTPLEIAGTDNDVIYRTYRGNVGAVPVSERVLRYEIPVTGAGKYDVRLHLAERCSCNGTVGRRKFDVEAEKRLVADDVDIFSASGALNTAYSLPLSGIPVTDGSLSLTLRTVSDYVSIAGIEVFCQGLCVGGSGDETAPAAPTNVSAVAGDGTVALTWDANSESDFAGYKVYRSTSSPVSTSGTARSGSTLLTSPQFTDTATNGTTYFYVVQAFDSSGNKATSATVSATPRNASVVALRVNFQSATAAVPTGYLRDFGEAYGPRTGTNQGSGETYGWVAPGTSTGRSMVGFGRDRNLVSDQRLDTHMQMQPAGSNPGAWEIAVPNGTYTVTVAVGDAAAVFTSTHRINAEGQNVIAGFTPTSGNRFATATATVTVADGKMTIDANGGTLTMIDYVWIAGSDGTAPTTPAAFAAIESQTDGVVLDWNDNTQKDLGGYNIYRASSSTGPFTKLNPQPVPGSFFQDAGTPPGSFYQVSAVDVGYHESARTAAKATTPAAPDSTRIAWQNFATSPVTRHEAAGIAVNGKLYAFGGFSAGNTPCEGLTGSCITKVAHVYNPATNTWSRLANMPEGVTHAGIASDGTAIYVAGGYLGTRPDGTQTFGTNHVWRYNIAANTWSSMPALPEARGSGNLAIIGRNLHFFGGANLSRADRKEHWILNLDGGTSWVAAALMADAATHRGSAVIGGKIYAVGGQKGIDANAVTQRTLQVWDPASPGAWTVLAPLPALTGGTGRSHIAASTFEMNGRLMVVGGDRAYFTPIANVTSYNPATNTWKEHTQLPLKRDSAIAAVINGTLFVTTGASSNTSYKGIPTDPSTSTLASSTTTSKTSTSNFLLGTSGGSSTDLHVQAAAEALCTLDPTLSKTVADHRPVRQRSSGA